MTTTYHFRDHATYSVCAILPEDAFLDRYFPEPDGYMWGEGVERDGHLLMELLPIKEDFYGDLEVEMPFNADYESLPPPEGYEWGSARICYDPEYIAVRLVAEQPEPECEA